MPPPEDAVASGHRGVAYYAEEDEFGFLSLVALSPAGEELSRVSFVRESALPTLAVYDDRVVHWETFWARSVTGTDLRGTIDLGEQRDLEAYNTHLFEERRFTTVSSDAADELVDLRDLTITALPPNLEARGAPLVAPGGRWLAGVDEDRRTVTAVRPDRIYGESILIEAGGGWTVRSLAWLSPDALRVAAEAEGPDRVAFIDVELEGRSATETRVRPDVGRDVLHPGNRYAAAVASTDTGFTLFIEPGTGRVLHERRSRMQTVPEMLNSHALVLNDDVWSIIDLESGEAEDLDLDRRRYGTAFRRGSLIILSTSNGASDEPPFVVVDAETGVWYDLGAAIGEIDGFAAVQSITVGPSGIGLARMRDGDEMLYVVFDADGVIVERRFGRESTAVLSPDGGAALVATLVGSVYQISVWDFMGDTVTPGDSLGPGWLRLWAGASDPDRLEVPASNLASGLEVEYLDTGEDGPGSQIVGIANFSDNTVAPVIDYLPVDGDGFVLSDVTVTSLFGSRWGQLVVPQTGFVDVLSFSGPGADQVADIYGIPLVAESLELDLTAEGVGAVPIDADGREVDGSEPFVKVLVENFSPHPIELRHVCVYWVESEFDSGIELDALDTVSRIALQPGETQFVDVPDEVLERFEEEGAGCDSVMWQLLRPSD